MTAVLDAPATTDGPTVRTEVRRWRAPLVALACLVVAASVVAAVTAGGTRGRLDPSSYDPDGSRAVAELLDDLGVDVERVRAGAVPLRDVGDATVVVPFPSAVPPEVLDPALRTAATLVLVEPGPDVLDGLGIAARVRGPGPSAVRRPACDLPAAQRAGDADLGRHLYRPTGAASAVGCYASGGAAAVLVLDGGGLVLLGDGRLLENGHLDERGHAALALGLLGGHDRVVWLLPPAQALEGEGRDLTDLLPDAVRLSAWHLLLVLGVVALWRARRLGGPVAEPLPVVVRAAEAVEGRSRLYRAARARGRAADALRDGARSRLVRRLGLAPSAPADAVVAALAARTGREAAALQALLYGPAPADDAALVRLADDLDALQGAVLSPAPAREVPRP